MFFEGIEYYQIPNFEGYCVSKCGKVLSTRPINGVGECNNKYARRLKPHITKGYERICLRKNKKKKMMSIHRLVAMTFLEDYSEDLQVDHKYHNKANNNLSNLRMVTQSNNQRNRFNAVGIRIVFDKRRNDYSYGANWYDETGKRKEAGFSVNKYGEVFAYLLAYNMREEMVAKYYNRP
tara:strand:- start:592 stop:1128 length:537 start_codon:yes stop_codon:yes gene_type:complete